ncbi:neuroblast differentiation-associated protein AHNAK [Fundulus heteroclitus]|uniref:neuroblast differentiation-associated protein AHNAK n=1 Tax=Fundulus heteroclitus TaxID=8078 RepID=UPI00165BE622|nr:neuroblast differentiation-associated protein AHNAK [Fundulus heteroclitus]
MDSPSGKIKWPTFKKPKWAISQPKVNGPDIDLDADVSGPDLNLSAPKIDGKLKSSDVDLNLPEADIDVGKPDINMDSPSGKINWPTFKKPKWAISQPKVNGPDIDLDADVSGPDLNLSAPKIDGDIGTPDINLNAPKAEMQSPKLDVNALEADVGPSGKFKWFSFTKNKTLPKADLDVKDIGLKGPEVDFRTADVNLSVPKIDAGIETTDLSISRPDVKLPEGGVNSPDVTLEPGDGKIKLPKVKLPKLKDPKMKEPDMDLNVKVPNAELKAPNVNLKGTHFSLQAPNIEGGLSGPEIDGTNFKTDVNLSLPNPTLNSPDMNISTKDLEAPDVEMKLPKTDANGTSLDLGNADLDLSAPKIDGTLWTPNTDAKLPNAELEAPDLTKKSPNLKINQPKVDLKAPDGQLKMPALDAHLGDFKMPHFKVPMLDLSSPNAEISTVQDTGKAGIEAPNFNMDSPTADASISIPAIEMNGPKVEGPKVNIKTPDVDGNVEKPKLPHLKLPKFSLSEYKDKSGEVNDTNNEDNDGDSNNDASNVETAVPLFKFHKLPTRTLDGIGDISEAIGLSKRDRGEKDFVVSKGIRLPISNAPKAIGKIDIMERLKLAKEKTTSVLQTDEKNDADLKLATPSLDVGVSAETGDSSLVRGGTDLEPGSADDIQKLSLGLSNMLGLKLDDPDAV